LYVGLLQNNFIKKKVNQKTACLDNSILQVLKQVVGSFFVVL